MLSQQTKNLRRLTYVSRATSLMKQDDLLNILDIARKKNKHNELTGMLLYKDQSFIQLLEGPNVSLESTFDSISNDPRHANITVLTNELVDQRLFIDWSMGFQNLDQLNGETLPQGFSHFMQNESLHTLLANDRASTLELLLYFRKAS